MTRLLDDAATGDYQAAADLLPLVYDELRRLATALVHETYLRLVGTDPGQPWNGGGHFFAAAAAMRHILVEAASRKGRLKRGGGLAQVCLDDVPVAPTERADDLLALAELTPEDPAKAEFVKLRYFAGLTLQEAAACQGVSLATAAWRWPTARAWLFDVLSSGGPPETSRNP